MSVDSPNLGDLDPYAFEAQVVEKPWGHELVWASTEHYLGKILFVRAGHSLSLQFHREKDESWHFLEGRAELEFGGPGERVTRSEVVSAGASFRLRPGTVHRIRALEDTRVLEVSTPHPDDVVRLEDAYGRGGAGRPGGRR